MIEEARVLELEQAVAELKAGTNDLQRQIEDLRSRVEEALQPPEMDPLVSASSALKQRIERRRRTGGR